MSGYDLVRVAVAEAAGLRVPATLITNRAASVREFADRYPAVAVTSLGFGSIVDADGRAALYTHVLSADDLANLDGIETTAHQVQQFVGDKDFEARVTVVGGRILAAAIRGDSAAASVDWRSDYGALQIDPVDVPTRSPGVSVLRWARLGYSLRRSIL